MAYAWQGYLILARALARNAHSAAKRTAVSRAYYAAFNLCRDWLESTGPRIPDRGAHQAVISALKDPGRPGITAANVGVADQIAGHLLWMKRARNICDYDDAVGDLGQLTTQTIARAELVVARLLPSL